MFPSNSLIIPVHEIFRVYNNDPYIPCTVEKVFFPRSSSTIPKSREWSIYLTVVSDRYHLCRRSQPPSLIVPVTHTIPRHLNFHLFLPRGSTSLVPETTTGSKDEGLGVIGEKQGKSRREVWGSGTVLCPSFYILSHFLRGPSINFKSIESFWEDGTPR